MSCQVSLVVIIQEEIRDLIATEKNLKYEVKMTDSKGSEVFVTNLKVGLLVAILAGKRLLGRLLITDNDRWRRWRTRRK